MRMALLIIQQGPDVGRKFVLEEQVSVLGRQPESTICLPARAVSREHARILRTDQGFLVEDLDSSNGTFLNRQRLKPHDPVPLTEQHTLHVGPYVLALLPTPTLTTTEPNLVIREQVSAVAMSQIVYGQDPAQKLQVVLDIAQHLARTLDLEVMLDKLLDHLMRLLPQTDRAMVLLCEGKDLVVRGQRCRHLEDASTYPYSRTVVRRALEEGVGILSDDIKDDQRFQSSETITALDMRSLICVPLIGQGSKRLGVIQLDRCRLGQSFRIEDLRVLTAVGLQVGVVLENAALHAELLHKERQDQELAMAREIQQSYLPSEFGLLAKAGLDLYACVHPARDMAGDLYDFFLLPDGRLAFFVGDVVGKGMPAALFMVAVHVLGRHLAKGEDSPAQTLLKLNLRRHGRRQPLRIVRDVDSWHIPAANRRSRIHLRRPSDAAGTSCGRPRRGGGSPQWPRSRVGGRRRPVDGQEIHPGPGRTAGDLHGRLHGSAAGEHQDSIRPAAVAGVTSGFWAGSAVDGVRRSGAGRPPGVYWYPGSAG